MESVATRVVAQYPGSHSISSSRAPGIVGTSSWVNLPGLRCSTRSPLVAVSVIASRRCSVAPTRQCTLVLIVLERRRPSGRDARVGLRAAEAVPYQGKMFDGSRVGVCRGGHRLYTCKISHRPLCVGLRPGRLRLVCSCRELCGGFV